MVESVTGDQPSRDQLLLIAQVHRWKMAFFGLVILLAGITIGVAGTMIWRGRSRPVDQSTSVPPGQTRTDLLMQRLRSALRLTDSQVKAIRPIVREHLANIGRIRQEVRPKVAEELRQMDQKVKAHLDDRQGQIWNLHFRQIHEQLQWQLPSERPRVQQPRGPVPERTEPNQPARPRQQY